MEPKAFSWNRFGAGLTIGLVGGLLGGVGIVFLLSATTTLRLRQAELTSGVILMLVGLAMMPRRLDTGAGLCCGGAIAGLLGSTCASGQLTLPFH